MLSTVSSIVNPTLGSILNYDMDKDYNTPTYLDLYSNQLHWLLRCLYWAVVNLTTCITQSIDTYPRILSSGSNAGGLEAACPICGFSIWSSVTGCARGALSAGFFHWHGRDVHVVCCCCSCVLRLCSST